MTMREVRNGVGLTVEERSLLAEARGTVVIAFRIMLNKFNRIVVGGGLLLISPWRGFEVEFIRRSRASEHNDGIKKADKEVT